MRTPFGSKMFRLLVLLAASLFVNMAALADDVGGALKMAPEEPLTSGENAFVVAAIVRPRVWSRTVPAMYRRVGRC